MTTTLPKRFDALGQRRLQAAADARIPASLKRTVQPGPCILCPSHASACDHEPPTLLPTTPAPIRILGVDPGLRVTGFGVIEKSGNRLAYLASGCIKTDAKASLPTRLGTIHAGLNELLAQYKPDQAVIEIVFVNVNPQSTLLLGQARGAAITTLVAGGVEVAEYTALQVKQAVVGNGHADKVQVQHMVRRLLSLPGDPSPDAADALACAIAHAHGGQGMGALATKGFRIRNGRMILGKTEERKQ